MGTETYHKTLGRYQGGNHGVKKIIPRWGRKLKGKIPNISNVITVKKIIPRWGRKLGFLLE